MIKRALVVVLAFWASSVSYGALTLDEYPYDPSRFIVGNDRDGAYSFWLEIADPSKAAFDGDPVFREAGNPTGDSWVEYWPEYGQWYEVLVASLDPGNPILAGDHVVVTIRCVGLGGTTLNAYADDGATLLASEYIWWCIPEPATVALLTLGLLLVRGENWRRGG